MAGRFLLGQVVITRGALDVLPPSEVLRALRRHESGDWGEVDAEDQKANEEAVHHGLRLLSAYRSSVGDRFWIITEADRSATTILLPEEY